MDSTQAIQIAVRETRRALPELLSKCPDLRTVDTDTISEVFVAGFVAGVKASVAIVEAEDE